MSGQYTFNRQIGCGNWASVWIVQPKRSAGVKAMKIVHRASQSGALQRFNALVNEYKVGWRLLVDCVSLYPHKSFFTP